MTQQTVTGIILTYNEELHIERAIDSLQRVANQIVVVDSFSTDATTAIAAAKGCVVLLNPWRNYATQFNWALKNLPTQTDWIIRFDADEIFTDPLVASLQRELSRASVSADAFSVARRIVFQGEPVRFGGIFPVHVVRVFRAGTGRCEQRWMDEHLIIKGEVRQLNEELLDVNLNSLSWWIQKHNSYASREAIDIINTELSLFHSESITTTPGKGQAQTKRAVKERLYPLAPRGFRAALYFLYRFVIRGGFLDRRTARSFHVLQGFWYRYLVDLKVSEIKSLINQQEMPPGEAIMVATGFDISEE